MLDIGCFLHHVYEPKNNIHFLKLEQSSGSKHLMVFLNQWFPNWG